jgi:3-hydroxybutyryl-CoA dehydrogenase
VSEPARVIGVLGAGTMGAGIAQLACTSGARTLLHDPIPAALEKGVERVGEGLGKLAARGRISEQDATAARERLEAVDSMAAFEPCELVIEAAPERMDLKREIYAQLSEIVSEHCVLATNTSSIPVTAIGGAASHPERVVGMHFFNPAPVMRLVEVIAGEESGEAALALTAATGEAMGKTVIRAADGPGFLVNRCNRPFGLEALRLLSERIADIPTIDRIVRMGGGFRMGPFELMDLVGVDVGLEVSRSFYELSFGEPRWRPSPITARYAAAGRTGRKAGRGYYDYGDGPHRPDDPEPPSGAGGEGAGVAIIGQGALVAQVRQAASAAGWQPVDTPSGDGAELTLVLCDCGSLASLDPGGGSVGFHALAPLEASRLVELTRGPDTSEESARAAKLFFSSLGKHTEWVDDAPGLVLGRIVCQVINESAFALGEGVGSAQDIDAGMVLGLNHPRGPMEWASAIGADRVLATLDALCDEYREERYRPAPALRRMAREA